MLTRLRLGNFKAFESLDLSFSRINLFFGPNNSGKSSILSALALLSQTLRSSDEDAKLVLNGIHEELGTYRDIIHANDPKKPLTIGVGIRYEDYTRKGKSEEALFEAQFRLKPRLNKIILERVEIEKPAGVRRLRGTLTKGGHFGLSLKAPGGAPIDEASMTLYWSHFIPRITPSIRALSKRREFPDYEQFHDLQDFSRALETELVDVEYIGPFRDFPKRTYLFSGETPTNVGARGERAIEIMVLDALKRGKRKKQLVNKVSHWFANADIAGKIAVARLTPRHYEIRLANKATKEVENLADVGFGCSQVLPILVAGYNAAPESILIIEQPELHLHPGAQAELGEFFLELRRASVQVFVETHSEHLLLRLMRHVAAGDMDPEDVRVFYVYADGTTARKHCVHLPLRPDGTFEKEWPQGFFPERYEEARAIAKAAAHKG